MRLRGLVLKNFGPFKEYSISLGEEDGECMLLTGKNNEGKSSIITALRLVDAATRALNNRRQEMYRGGNTCFSLFKQDTENLLIGRMVHNYESNEAEIHANFSGNLDVSVFLDPSDDIIYANYTGRIPSDIEKILGFIPPLGPLSESEDIIQRVSYLKACLNSSLAPRHLRNHLFQILSKEEFEQVREIIKDSWKDIELCKYEVDSNRNKIYCYFKERGIEREICWAGQGLQVWFQIITHLVRLQRHSILVLDEPEINLHPEKQNDLIRIIRERFAGGVLVATHSVELMNNVSVSHIINVQKKQSRPQMKSTSDRQFLEIVRSQIGSNFNLIASQFQECDLILFTEDTFDFDVLAELAKAYGIKRKAFNIPLHGFSEYDKAPAYKKAYEVLIGRTVNYTAVFDRDFYPEEHLLKVKKQLEGCGIRTVFTPGKEVENLFLAPALITEIIPASHQQSFAAFWEEVFVDSRNDCYGSYISLHGQFLPRKLDTKTIIKKYGPYFDQTWEDVESRYKIINGKDAMAKLRDYYRRSFSKNLTWKECINILRKTNDPGICEFVASVYHESRRPR